MKQIGQAFYKKGVLYFDDRAWKYIKKQAEKEHTTPRNIVITSLKRYMRLYKKKPL